MILKNMIYFCTVNCHKHYLNAFTVQWYTVPEPEITSYRTGYRYRYWRHVFMIETQMKISAYNIPCRLNTRPWPRPTWPPSTSCCCCCRPASAATGPWAPYLWSALCQVPVPQATGPLGAGRPSTGTGNLKNIGWVRPFHVLIGIFVSLIGSD